MSRGFAGIWILLILWFSLLLCVHSLRQQKYKRLLLSISTAGVSYYLLQIYGGDYGVQVSFYVIIAACLLCSIVIILGMIQEYRWRQLHLSEMSVKYAVDALPSGICCYDTDGKVLLKNKTMDWLHRQLTGEALLNGDAFEKMIFMNGNDLKFVTDIRRLAAGDHIVIIFPDHKVYEFSKHAFEDKNTKTGRKQKFILTAGDITEEYRKTQTLLAKQQTVEILNKRLREYNKEILSVITAKEVLNAKVKIHDELGTSLLRVKKYLADKDSNKGSGTKEKEKQEQQAILDVLRQNVTFLQRQLHTKEEDEYELLLKTAQQLDVDIDVKGRLPKEERIRNICVTALHECLTNTLRHARGNYLGVTFVEDEYSIQAVYTNNGSAPDEEIVEKGGLKSLRGLVEQEGGSMNIQTAGGFSLTIRMEKRGNRYGI